MTGHALGRLLRPLSAGIERTVGQHPSVRSAPEIIRVTSSAFPDGAPIPRRYAGKGVGENVSPPLAWFDVPHSCAELVLVVEDPDVPLPRPVVHGLFAGINPHPGELSAGALNSPCASDIRAGYGSFRRRGYAGPRPVPGHGPHRYLFQIFALDGPSDLDENTTVRHALRAIRGHVIARGQLTGTYERA